MLLRKETTEHKLLFLFPFSSLFSPDNAFPYGIGKHFGYTVPGMHLNSWGN